MQQQQQQFLGGKSNISDDYSTVLKACNTLLFNLGKNIWSKYFPEESSDHAKLNLQFDIAPGDNTPRQLLACLAKQVHNIKCVAKILERVKEAEKQLQSLEDADEVVDDQNANNKPEDLAVNLTQLNALSAQLATLAKCSAAMRRRHSVRHRVIPVEPGKVICQALCDIDCPTLGIRLSQQSSYILKNNRSQQLWQIEDTVSGVSQQVPPLLLIVEPDSAELVRIRRVQKGLGQLADRLTGRLASQLINCVRSLRAQKEDLIQLPSLNSSDSMKSFLYRLQMLEKCLKPLQQGTNEAAQWDSSQWGSLVETIDSLLGKINVDSVSKPASIASLLLKMRNELQALKGYAVAKAAEVAAAGASDGPRHLTATSGDALGGSRRSLRSGRSHRLTGPNRRTGGSGNRVVFLLMFEFEFEFLESTRKRSTSTSRPTRSASTSDLTSEASHRFSSQTVTRQRQEVAQKFVIQSVWNGRRDVSLQEAVASGVVNFERGIYIELLGNRQEMPLQAAMSAGKIRVELVTSEKLSEDTSSYGLISVEEHRQSTSGDSGTTVTSYVVHAVVDVSTKERLGFQEALQKGLIDRETGAFTNSATGEVLPIGEAIHKGLCKAYPVDDANSLNIEPENRISVTKFHKLKSRWSAISAFSKK